MADTFRPFSNGSEYLGWLEGNCGRGGGCRFYNPEAVSADDGCAMEVALAIGCIDDGNMPVDLGIRCGLHDGEKPKYGRCPEYRDSDEDDDGRPHHVPPQPDTQLDLLDPRQAPTLTVVM